MSIDTSQTTTAPASWPARYDGVCKICGWQISIGEPTSHIGERQISHRWTGRNRRRYTKYAHTECLIQYDERSK